MHHHWLLLHHHGLLHHHRLHDWLHHWLLSDVHLSVLRSRGRGDLLGYICRLLAAAVAADTDQDDDEYDAANNATNNSSKHVGGLLNGAVIKERIERVDGIADSGRADVGPRIVV